MNLTAGWNDCKKDRERHELVWKTYEKMEPGGMLGPFIYLERSYFYIALNTNNWSISSMEQSCYLDVLKMECQEKVIM